jgi:large subunit ribosomal protein L27Ae
MRHLPYLPCCEWNPTINIDKLWTLVSDEVREQAAKGGAAPIIDLPAKGYFKVIGRSELPKIVRARDFSESAEKKIKEAGGACEKVVPKGKKD